MRPERPPRREPPPPARRSAARRAGRALLSLALLAALAAGAAWLATPEPYASRLPGDEALGTLALGDVRAARDYDIVDEEATRALREAAAAAEPRVYAYDDAASEGAAAHIRAAFGAARASLAPPRAPARGRPRAAPAPADAGRVAAALRPAFSAALGVDVDEAAVAALVEGRFAEALEQHLVALASHGLWGKVVLDRAALPADARGVVARTVRGGAAEERPLADLAVVREVAEARADVERAAASLPASVPPAQRAALATIAAALARPTLVYDEAETQRRERAAAERAAPAVIHLRRGERIVSDGERIERRHLIVFRGIRAQARPADLLRVRGGAAALVAALLALLWRHARRAGARFRPSPRDALLLALALAATGALAALGLALGDVVHDRLPRLAPEAIFYLVPFAVGAFVVRSVLSAEVALLFAIAGGAVVGLAAGHSLVAALHALLTSIAAAGVVGRRDRAAPFRAGAAVGAVGAVVVGATHLLTGRSGDEALAPAAAAALGGALLLPLLAVAALRVAERAFGYLTDVKLLDLASLNQPALKDLIVQAPGTYHHAVIVGALVEGAAEAIGANALLARVCAYYHDIGKIRNPQYFAENQRGEDRHDQLAPSMSALIVKRHVTDGVELASQWKLPPAVVDAIREHHGTRFVSFWARSAEAASPDDGALEELFRYPGPRPQSRETALVMIADACEASARALREPTAERLRALVKRRIEEISREGQLDDCELTLKDLNAIGLAMVRGLGEIYRDRADGAPQPGAAAGAPPLQVVRRGGP